MKVRKKALTLSTAETAASIALFRELLSRIGCELTVSSDFREIKGKAWDLVLNRRFGMDYSDADLDWLEKERANCLNPPSAQRICRDKWLTHSWLETQGIATPTAWRAKDFAPEFHSGPLVLKTLRGMQGRGVSFWERGEDLLKHLETNDGDTRYIVQKRISFHSEVRSLHLGENIYWFEKSGSSLYQGGSAKALSSPPAGLEETAKKIQSLLGLRLAAIDYLIDERQSWVVDVNCYPGLKLAKGLEEKLADVLSEAIHENSH